MRPQEVVAVSMESGNIRIKRIAFLGLTGRHHHPTVRNPADNRRHNKGKTSNGYGPYETMRQRFTIR